MSPEDYYRSIFEQSRDIVLIADMEGRILDANPAATRLYGYSLEELRSMAPGSLMTSASRLLMHSRLEQVANEKDTIIETAHECKDGTLVYLEAHSSLIDYRGAPAILNILRDITPRLQAEDKMRLLASIVDSSEDAIFVKQLDGTITSWNAGAERLYGYTDAEIIGRNVSVLLPVDRSDEVTRILEGIARGERFEYFETRRVAKDGHLIDVSMTISPVKDAAGDVIVASSIARDITESKKTEERLRKANEELQAFASVVSHDLRGPLAAIRVGDETLRTLMAGEQTDETRAVAVEVVDLMHRSLLRADHLIDNLLRLAGAGQVPSKLERVDVVRVVATVLEERAADIASGGIEVEVSDDLGELMADPTHIYQLFSNLIGNAITHNDSERPALRVLRRPDAAAGGHRYVVCDNGSGIAEEDIGKIFTPFFRGKSGGIGIGLNIVQKIAQVYGGGVTVHNEGGACFEVTLRDFPGQE